MASEVKGHFYKVVDNYVKCLCKKFRKNIIDYSWSRSFESYDFKLDDFIDKNFCKGHTLKKIFRTWPLSPGRKFSMDMMFWKSKMQHFNCFKDVSYPFWCFVVVSMIMGKSQRHQIWQSRLLLGFTMLWTIVFLFKMLFFHCYFYSSKSERQWQFFCCFYDD